MRLYTYLSPCKNKIWKVNLKSWFSLGGGIIMSRFLCIYLSCHLNSASDWSKVGTLHCWGGHWGGCARWRKIFVAPGEQDNYWKAELSFATLRLKSCEGVHYYHLSLSLKFHKDRSFCCRDNCKTILTVKNHQFSIILHISTVFNLQRLQNWIISE